MKGFLVDHLTLLPSKSSFAFPYIENHENHTVVTNTTDYTLENPMTIFEID